MDNRQTLIGGMFKLLIIISLPLAVIFGLLGITSQTFTSGQLLAEPSFVLRVPFTMREWSDIGSVMEPIIHLPVQTLAGFEKTDFIVDSGAVISSLPREWAEKIGRDLAFAKRITFKGFGNTLSFAYQSQVTVQLGNETVDLPLVFTEAEGTRALLGRKGFFDAYSIFFDHTNKVME
ncbi:retroviral-like aspartic protease family protein, partial [Patescibacteria group bacterium]|nr:retroviral-like aspartic protease family protein [Patescibacteria group bacterium]